MNRGTLVVPLGQSRLNVPRKKSHPLGGRQPRFAKELHHRRSADDSLAAKKMQKSNVIRLEIERVKGGRGRAYLTLTYSTRSDGDGGYSARSDGDGDTLATFLFSIALEGNTKSGAANSQQTVDKIEVVHSERVLVGQWLHLVAVYDGRQLVLHINNVSASSIPACQSRAHVSGLNATRGCGTIVYGQEAWLSSYCRSEQTPFTLGTYDDRYAQQKFSHIGALKSVRIFKTALSSAQVVALYAAGAALPATPIDQYWVKSSGRMEDPNSYPTALPQMRSPDSTAAIAHTSSKIQLLGGFRSTTRYRAEFSYHEPSGALLSEVSEECRIDGVTLQCDTPLWPHGFRAALLSVSYASARDASPPHWTPLWQKVGAHTSVLCMLVLLCFADLCRTLC